MDQDDVIAMQEGFLAKVFRELKGVEIQLPLPRITWDEAMERYGSDKPDTRFGFELKKLNDVVKDCGFKVFTDRHGKRRRRQRHLRDRRFRAVQP